MRPGFRLSVLPACVATPDAKNGRARPVRCGTTLPNRVVVFPYVGVAYRETGTVPGVVASPAVATGGILHAISEEFPALRCAGEGDRHARRPACRTLERRRCSRMFVVEAFVVDVGRDEPPGRNDASEARDNLYRQMYMHFRVTKKYFVINRLYQCVGGGLGVSNFGA